MILCSMAREINKNSWVDDGVELVIFGEELSDVAWPEVGSHCSSRPSCPDHLAGFGYVVIFLQELELGFYYFWSFEEQRRILIFYWFGSVSLM